MAKLKVFTVRDSKVEAYLQPFFMRSYGEAERAFRTVMNNPEHQMSKHPEDFSLYEIGDYDDNTGIIEPLMEPKHIVKGVDVHKAYPQEKQ